MDRQIILNGIANVCRKKSAIRLAYLHGSYATGYADDESDVDIAVLLDDALSREERHTIRMDMISKFAFELDENEDRIDLVILNDIPVLLKWNVICKGIRCYADAQDVAHFFELRVEQEWDDVRFTIRMENDTVLERAFTHPII